MQTSDVTIPVPVLHRTVITSQGGWRAINFAELWRYRELLAFMVWRDVKVRYKQTVLGAAWAVLQPAMMMVALTLVLGKMAKVPGADDPVFVYAGILPWTFFATAMANAANSLVASERLITKIYFPRLAVPLSAVGAAVVDFLIALILLIGMMIWRGVMPGPGILMAPIIFAIIGIAAAGVGTLLAALTVAYRDFRYIIPFLAQFWLFATPTIYTPLADLQSSVWPQRAFVVLNPMSGLIAAFRASMLNDSIPFAMLGWATLIALAVLVLGCFYFRRVEDSFADIV